MEYILLVEDDKQLSFITKRMLVSKGYGVVTAFSIRQAKYELKKREFEANSSYENLRATINEQLLVLEIISHTPILTTLNESTTIENK